MSQRISVALLVGSFALLGPWGGFAHAAGASAVGGAVKVIGASLEDSGTFGFKFTVQSATGQSYRTYVEQLAAARGLPALCHHYTLDASTGTPTGPVRPSCTNFAVAGAQIHNFSIASGQVDDNSPSSVVRQMADLGAGGFGRSDLVIVGEAVGNDLEALLTAAGTVSTSGPTGFSAYVDSLLGEQVAEHLITNAGKLSGGNPSLGVALAGVRFMTALADKLMAHVQGSLIHKGAQRVAILNALDVLKTPVFHHALSTLSATDQTSTRVLALAWVWAFNTELGIKAAGSGGKVIVIDLYRGFNAEYAHPQQYGLTNVTSTVCTQTYQHSIHGTASLATAGTDVLDTPEVRAACNDLSASSITPTEGATGPLWWTTYLFADNFHPTPYGHQLLAQSVSKKLSQVGWR